MPTSEERREVAARLREAVVSRCLTVAIFELDCGDFGTCEECGKYCANRLADLIEPEERTCHPVDAFDKKTRHIVERGQTHYYWPYSGCSGCGCDFPQGSNYCPNCGAKMVD